MINEIMKLSRELHDIAKYSNSWLVCIDRAMTELIGNEKISKWVSELGITKKDYVEYVLKVIQNQ